MSDELLNKTPLFGLNHARTTITEWADDYNEKRPHSALGYITPAAHAANLTNGLLAAQLRRLHRPPIAHPAPYGVKPGDALMKTPRQINVGKRTKGRK